LTPFSIRHGIFGTSGVITSTMRASACHRDDTAAAVGAVLDGAVVDGEAGFGAVCAEWSCCAETAVAVPAALAREASPRRKRRLLDCMKSFLDTLS